MRPLWLRNLAAGEEELIRREFEMAALFRAKLVELLQEEIDKSVKEMRTAVRADTANLHEFYIDALAKQRTLEEVITLIIK